MTSTDIALRLTVVVLGVVAGAAVLAVRHVRRRQLSQGARLRQLGGGLLCIAVAAGTLGALFHVDTVIRIPLVVVFLAWVAAGAFAELVDERRLRK